MDCSPWGFSVHGIFQGRILTGCHFLLQGISPTWESNLCLLHHLVGRQILHYRATWEAQIYAHTRKVSVFCLCPQQFFKPGQVTLTSGQFLGLPWQSSCEDTAIGGTGSISGWGAKIPHAVWYGQKKKSKVSGQFLYLVTYYISEENKVISQCSLLTPPAYCGHCTY